MQFTPATAAAILAFASSAAAAPYYGDKNSTSAHHHYKGGATGTGSYGWTTSTYSSGYASPTGGSGYSSSYDGGYDGSYSTSTYDNSYSTSTSTSDYPSETSGGSYGGNSGDSGDSGNAGNANGGSDLGTLQISNTTRILLSDTRADAINNVLVDDSQFVFDFTKAGEKVRAGAGGKVVPANRKTFPALTNTGVGAAIAYLEGCGFNTPHVHPRATELAVVVEGTVVTSMFPENGVNRTDGTPREVLARLGPYDATVFFQGAVHSQFNPNCEPAVFVAAFNSEDFGVGQVADEVFNAADEDLTASIFGNSIPGEEVDMLKHKISKNVALGVESCLAKCGKTKRTVV